MDTSEEPRLYPSLEGIIMAVTGLYLHKYNVWKPYKHEVKQKHLPDIQCQATHRARAGFQVIQNMW